MCSSGEEEDPAEESDPSQILRGGELSINVFFKFYPVLSDNPLRGARNPFNKFCCLACLKPLPPPKKKYITGNLYLKTLPSRSILN